MSRLMGVVGYMLVAGVAVVSIALAASGVQP